MDVRRCSEVRRRMALVQAVEQGESIALVARKANCDRKTVYSALARYAQGGLVGLVLDVANRAVCGLDVMVTCPPKTSPDGTVAELD